MLARESVLAVMSTVTAMFVVALSIFVPWVTLTEHHETYDSSIEYHLQYLEGRYSRLYVLPDDDPIGQILERATLIIVIWLLLALPFVRFALTESRIWRILFGVALLLACLSASLYSAVAVALTPTTSYQDGDFTVSTSLAIGWYMVAIATIIQSVGILQLILSPVEGRR